MKKLLFLGLLALPFVGHAQEDGFADSLRMLDELVVSKMRVKSPTVVSKIPVPMRQVPIASVALSGLKLAEMNFTDLSQSMRDIPGVHSFRDYGGFNMFYIRGFYRSIVLNDGMRDERHGLWQSAPITGLSSVDRIEVLKGAASMTVGHSALGGVVNILRKQPTAKKQLNTRISVGSWGTYNIQAGAGGALTDRINYRADAELSTSNGWRGNYSKGANAYLAFDYNISSLQKLSLSVAANTDSYRGDNGQPHLLDDVFVAKPELDKDGRQVFNPDGSAKMIDELRYRRGAFASTASPETRYSAPLDHLDNASVAMNVKYQLHLNDQWRLNNHTYFSYDDIDYYATETLAHPTSEVSAEVNNSPYYFYSEGKKTYIDLNRIERYGFAFNYNTLSIQNQLDLAGKVDLGATRHHLLASYNLSWLRTPRFHRPKWEGEGFTKTVDLVNPQHDTGYMGYEFRRRRLNNELINGLALQDFMTWGNLSALAGMRLDHFSSRTVFNETKGFEVGKEQLNINENFFAFTYRLGLVYNFSKNFNVYASTSNYFRPQRRASSSDSYYFIDSKGNELTDDNLTNLSPERGVQYEAGFHLDIDKTFSLSGAVYQIDLDNKFVYGLGVKDGKTIAGPVARSRSKGFELDAFYAPNTMVEFNAGYSYTDARILDYSTNKFAKDVAAGKFLERVPEHKATGWVFFNQGLGRFGGFRLGLGVEHLGRAFTDGTNNIEIPAFTLGHAMLSYKYKNWTLQTNLNNIADTLHYRVVVGAGNQFVPAEGRNVHFSIVYNL